MKRGAKTRLASACLAYGDKQAPGHKEQERKFTEKQASLFCREFSLLFTVRFAHSRPAKLACPGAVAYPILLTVASCFFDKLRNDRPQPGSGEGLPPRRELEGSALVVLPDLI